MPRQARIDAPGAVHHIIARGIERRRIFRDDRDRYDFIQRLGNLVVETKTRCYAWALIPNHFHLLLKTGSVPIATVMRRLLTGYAIGYNRRHRRSGHLFQNRYKSILCQEDVYLLELVRYIHLNPLRAGLVKDLAALDRYYFSGHSYLMGKSSNDWQSITDILELFGSNKPGFRKRYRDFLKKGIALGRQTNLVGGGLVRSAGGWTAVRSLRKSGIFQKSDERILGDGDFVETVLSDANEVLDAKHSFAAKGVEFEDILEAVSGLLGIETDAIKGPSKERTMVKARTLVCYWAVRELGFSMTDVASRLAIAVSTVSVAVKKGMNEAQKRNLSLNELLDARP